MFKALGILRYKSIQRSVSKQTLAIPFRLIGKCISKSKELKYQPCQLLLQNMATCETMKITTWKMGGFS